MSDDRDRENLVEQFCQITGASKDVGRQMLEACNDDLHMAVTLHLETVGFGDDDDNDGRDLDARDQGRRPRDGGNTNTRDAAVAATGSAGVGGGGGGGGGGRMTFPPPPQDSSSSSSVLPAAASSGLSSSAPPPPPPPPPVGSLAVNSGPAVALPSAPSSSIVSGTPKAVSSAASQASATSLAMTAAAATAAAQAVSSAQQRAAVMAVNGGGTGTGSSSTAPTVDRPHPYPPPRRFDDLFRPPFDIMFQGSFMAARDAGTQRNRWLLVDLHNDMEFKCQMLNRDVWYDERIKTLVRENFVFWQVNVGTDEGTRFQNFYPQGHDMWPFYAVIDPRTGEKIVSWDETEPNLVYQLLNDFLGERPAPDVEQLQPAPTASPKAAQRASKKPAATKPAPQARTTDAVAKSLGEMRLKDGDDSNDRNQTSAPAAARKDSSSSTRWRQFLGPSADPPSELLLRFPDGGKDVVSMPSSSKLQAVILYAESLGYPSATYALMTAFPRRNVSDLPSDSTLKDLGLFPRETLIITKR